MRNKQREAAGDRKTETATVPHSKHNYKKLNQTLACACMSSVCVCVCVCVCVYMFSACLFTCSGHEVAHSTRESCLSRVNSASKE